MVRLERNARPIVTDSGGVQTEAFFYRVPCVTVRDETKWVELVELGWNRVVPPVSFRAVYEGIPRVWTSSAGRAIHTGTGPRGNKFWRISRAAVRRGPRALACLWRLMNILLINHYVGSKTHGRSIGLFSTTTENAARIAGNA